MKARWTDKGKGRRCTDSEPKKEKKAAACLEGQERPTGGIMMTGANVPVLTVLTACCTWPRYGRSIDDGHHHRRWHMMFLNKISIIYYLCLIYYLPCLIYYLPWLIYYLPCLIYLDIFFLQVLNYWREYWRVREKKEFGYKSEGVTWSGHVNWYDSRGGNLRCPSHNFYNIVIH